jgi:hypothetical protein
LSKRSDRRSPRARSPGAEPVRVFVDADVLFAGSASTTGASHLVLQLSELGIIRAFTSRQARDEVERNLTRKLPAALPAFRALANAACAPAVEPTFNVRDFGAPKGIQVAEPGEFLAALRSRLAALAE